MWHSILLPLLLLLSIQAVHSAVFTASPQQSSTPLPPPILPSRHLVFSLDANHHSTSSPSFHPLSTSSPSSRFSLLQATVASGNLTGCASIDFSALVTVNGQGPFRLILDTGSTTLAVVASDCTSCGGATPTFSGDSSSRTNGGNQVVAQYGGGTSWSGFTYQSSVALGDSRAVSMHMATIDSNNGFINGADVCAVNVGAPTSLNTSQGIIGFAYPALALSNTDSWLSNYVAATGISNEFTIQMCPVGGNVWVGGYDGNFLSGAFTYIPIISPRYYSVMLTDISVVNHQGTSTSTGYTQSTFGPCQSSAGNDCAILDSGTTLILLPSAARTRLVTLIRNDPYYQSVFDSVTAIDPLIQTTRCASASTVGFPSLATLQANLPRLTFTFTAADGSSPQTLTINSIPGYLSLNFDNTGTYSYYCNGLGESSPAAILGYAFINQFTVRHDLANQRMGLAATANCGQAAPPLPSYSWVGGTAAFGPCSATCGTGVQWRQINCTDQWGMKHADIACATQYLSPRPIDSQTCNTQACGTLTPPTFTSVTAGSTLTPGQSYTVTFSYTGTTPDYIVLFLTPTTGSSTTLPSYITHNATSTAGTGAYTFTVPSAATIPPGTYYLGAYATGAQFGSTAVYTSTAVTTVASCTSGSCGADPCAGGSSVCNGHGECDGVSGAAVCTCIPGWSDSTCSVSANNGVLYCEQNGVVDSSSSVCDCNPSFTGPQCEQPYVNMSATFSITSTSLATGNNLAVFTNNAVQDLSFALGAYPHQITIQQVTPTTTSTLVLFSFQSFASASDVIAKATALKATVGSTLLSTGLASGGGGGISAMSILSEPPVKGGGGSDGFLSQWWAYIVGGVLGFFLILFILYCIAGGRCWGCRQQFSKRKMNASTAGGVRV